MRHFVAVVALLLGPYYAVAAPFCVTVQGLPDQCNYVDGRECQARASQLGGVCAANPAEVTAQSGPGKFCLVIGGQASVCIYPDRTSCEQDASRRHTACVQAAVPPQEAVDPYAIRRPY